jgi:hypothetical protein
MRRLTMTNQFQNPEVEKLEDKTISKISPKKDMERVAEKMAEKASKAVHENEKDESEFSK